jgi:ATP-dependent Clp protease adaptor protein ClpS
MVPLSWGEHRRAVEVEKRRVIVQGAMPPPHSSLDGFVALGPDGGGDGQGPGQSGEEDVEVEERQRTQAPKRYKVIFHNDDYTTMEYVIEVLRRFFHKNETEAVHIMLTVHKKGKAVAGIYPRDVAETKVAEVIQDARDRGHPLLLTTEPEE